MSVSRCSASVMVRSAETAITMANAVNSPNTFRTDHMRRLSVPDIIAVLYGVRMGSTEERDAALDRSPSAKPSAARSSRSTTSRVSRTPTAGGSAWT
jgi:hypothetical protein